MIKAIETEYADCWFRSRLEARWAVFFDALGVTWEYEPEGFHTSAGNYLPDFYLPAQKTWVEVKGDPAGMDLPRMASFSAEVFPNRLNEHWSPGMVVLGPVLRSDQVGSFLGVNSLSHANGGETQILSKTFDSEEIQEMRGYAESKGVTWNFPEGVIHNEAWLMPPDGPTCPEWGFVSIPILNCHTLSCEHDLRTTNRPKGKQKPCWPVVAKALKLARSERFGT